MDARAGFTLLELLIVVGILSLLAATTFLVRTDADGADAVRFGAQEVASALRFARADAMRVGTYRAAIVDPDTGQVRVAEVSTVSGTPVLGATLMHPIEHKAYDFVMGELPMTQNVKIANADDPFTFVGLASALNTVLFDADGNAVMVWLGTVHHLKEAWVDLKSGSHGRKVTLSPHGRVVVQ